MLIDGRWVVYKFRNLNQPVVGLSVYYERWENNPAGISTCTGCGGHSILAWTWVKESGFLSDTALDWF